MRRGWNATSATANGPRPRPVRAEGDDARPRRALAPRARRGAVSARAKALLRAHRSFLLLLAVFVPLAVHFAWHPDIATLGDDSVSYLALASYYSGHVSDPLLARCTWWSAH